MNRPSRVDAAAVEAPVYLDHNATTPVERQVVEAMLPYLTTHFGNPSSAHAAGPPARRAVEHARDRVAALIGAGGAGRLVFTGSGSEADALAIRGVVLAAIAADPARWARARPQVITQ